MPGLPRDAPTDRVYSTLKSFRTSYFCVSLLNSPYGVLCLIHQTSVLLSKLCPRLSGLSHMRGLSQGRVYLKCFQGRVYLNCIKGIESIKSMKSMKSMKGIGVPARVYLAESTLCLGMPKSQTPQNSKSMCSSCAPPRGTDSRGALCPKLPCIAPMCQRSLLGACGALS